MPVKNIQLQIDVYTRLEGFRGKRETFSEAVDRLLTMLEKVGELRDVLEGQIAFRNSQKEKLEHSHSIGVRYQGKDGTWHEGKGPVPPSTD